MKTYLKIVPSLLFLLGLTTPSIAMATKLFSPYVDLTLSTVWNSQYQELEPQDLAPITQASGIKSYHLAFITDSGSCSPAWGGQSAYALSHGWGSRLIAKLRAQGTTYLVSFGGASGNDLSLSCSVPQLVAAYEQVIKIYQPQGLDFDIENGTAKVGRVMQALQQIQAAHPEVKLSFTLPVMPEGLVSGGEEVVTQAKAANLNYAVNIMAMDYGPSYVNDMGEYAIQAATHLYRYLKKLYPEKTDAALWQMIEITPMIGVNDVSVEQFTLADVDILNRFAEENKVGGLSMWSVSRDKPCTDKWANSYCSGNNLQTKPYEFSEHFMR